MSIASRIESIEEHIGNAYDSIEALGVDITGVNKNIENISSSIDGIYDILPKVTGEGESISLDGTIKGRLKTTLKGNTSQNGTPTPDTPIPVNVVSGDNTIQVISKDFLQDIELTSGYIDSNNQIVSSTSWKHSDYIDITNYDYYIVDNNIGSSPKSIIYNESKTPIQVIDLNKNSKYTYDLKSYTGAKYLRVSSTGTITDYQHLIAQNDYQVNLPVENLLGLQDVSQTTINGLTYSVSNDEITINGTSTTAFGIIFNLKNSIPTINGVNYTLSKNTEGTNGYYAVQLRSNNTTIKEVGYVNLPITYNDLSVTIDGIRLFVANEVTFSNYKIKLQIEKGTTKANSYTPYGTTPIELCKIGTYQDYIYKDNGSWYLHKEIGKKQVLSTDNLTYSQANSVFLDQSFGNLYNSTAIPYCNYLKGVSSVSGNSQAYQQGDNKCCFRYGSTEDRLYLTRYDITTLEDFKTWLDSIDLIVYYVLATPTNTLIEDTTLIEQLEALKLATSYATQTNISQENNDLPFIISASALKEWSE